MYQLLTISIFFVFVEQGCERTSQTICRSSAAKVFPHNYHRRGLCDRSCADGSCNLPHDEKVFVTSVLSLFSHL